MSHRERPRSTPRPTRAIRLSHKDFAAWGLDKAAYVRPASGKQPSTGEIKYAVHAADGRRLGTLDSRDHAIAAIIDQGMEPMSVH